MQEDERMVDIEIKLSRQEDLLDSLNQTVYQQQKQIDKLEGLCRDLRRQLLELTTRSEHSGISPAHEKPPHY